MNITQHFAPFSILACIALAACAHTANTPAVSQTNAWSNAKQAVVVITDGWDNTQARQQRFERDPSGAWRAVGNAVPVVLGRSGSAWGIGLHPAQTDGPQKKEGDGRNPAGIFGIGNAFGYPASVQTRLPYIATTAQHWCMDVPASPLYNRIVDERDVGAEAVKGSTEPMRLDLKRASDDRYKFGYVIEHNPGNVPGMGSCIFAHLWGKPDQTTAGCTAMTEVVMRETLAWLDPKQHPVFVLMPRAQYRARQAEWNLPPLSNGL